MAVAQHRTQENLVFMPVLSSFQAVLEFGVGQRECNASKQPGKVRETPEPQTDSAAD